MSGSLFPLSPEHIAAGDVWIATGADGQIAGFVGAGARRAGHAGLGTSCSSSRRHIRGGIGRALLALVVDEARGAERLTILADPDATCFYERNGGVRIGESPSDAGARPPAPAG